MIVLTSDQDWAPSWATDALLGSWREAGVAGTFFVTNACQSLAGVGLQDGIELAWHPNFMAGSSHGSSTEEVLSTLRELVPNSLGVRSHYLVRSTALLQEYGRQGLLYEASDLMDAQPGLRAIPSWNSVVRVPIYWADDVHAMHGRAFELSAMDLDAPGLKVFAFHPIHVALNTRTLSGYRAFHTAMAEQERSMTEATPDEVARFREDGPGTADLLAELLEFLSAHPERCAGTVSAVARQAWTS